MTDDKSRIQSASVSLFSKATSGNAQTTSADTPWSILILSDLGYRSKAPQRVYAAEWNDYMAACRAVLSGTVEGVLTGENKPLYIEYPIESLRDFSAESLRERLVHIAPARSAIELLRSLLDGKIDVTACRSRIEQSAIHAGIKLALLSLLGKAALKDSPQSGAVSARLDGLLSSMNLGSGDAPSPVSQPQRPASPTDALFTAVAGDNALPRRELEQHIATLERLISDQIDLVRRADFFSRRNASWQMLKQTAGLVGRKKEIAVTVYSCEAESFAESLPAAIKGCFELGLPPDIILIDREFSFSSADSAAMESIAETASSSMCAVIASLDSNDALFDDIASKETLAQFFDDVRFIPYKRVRSNPATRNLVLCGPALTIAISDATAIAACAGWHALSTWIQELLLDGTPFAGRQYHREAADEPSLVVSIPAAVAEDCAAAGLTLFGIPVRKCKNMQVVTVVDEQAAAPAYTQFGYNVAVNRIMRLTARRIAESDGVNSVDELKNHLFSKLAKIGLLSSKDEIEVVEAEGGNRRITINSAETVSGYPVQIQFTM
jgi:predicted component of type VI protein secretion system